MSTFTFNQYNDAINAAQNKTATTNVKVGWFKLANDQDEALVRINISKLEDMQFATVHQLGANTNWMKVSCLNEFGSFTNKCPLCAAVEAGNTNIGKAAKRVYIPMLVAYKDRITGQWAAPIPVIWDKPAGFSREIANAVKEYGDLRQVMFKVTRNGVKGDMKTTYPMSIVLPTNPVLRPEMIPMDFSAFDTLRLDKHSYWVKTADEINEFLTTGAFPEVVKTEPKQEPVQSVAQVGQTYTQPVAPVVEPVYQAPVVEPVYTPPTMIQPQPAPVYQAPAQGYGNTNKFTF